MFTVLFSLFSSSNQRQRVADLNDGDRQNDSYFIQKATRCTNPPIIRRSWNLRDKHTHTQTTQSGHIDTHTQTHKLSNAIWILLYPVFTQTYTYVQTNRGQILTDRRTHRPQTTATQSDHRRHSHNTEPQRRTHLYWSLYSALLESEYIWCLRNTKAFYHQLVSMCSYIYGMWCFHVHWPRLGDLKGAVFSNPWEGGGAKKGGGELWHIWNSK